MDAQAPRVSVSYERRISDGDYGFEAVFISSSWSIDAPEAVPLGDGLMRIRQVALEHLSQSGAERVAAVARREARGPAQLQPVNYQGADDYATNDDEAPL